MTLKAEYAERASKNDLPLLSIRNEADCMGPKLQCWIDQSIPDRVR
jgi:hypothetical protein